MCVRKHLVFSMIVANSLYCGRHITITMNSVSIPYILIPLVLVSVCSTFFVICAYVLTSVLVYYTYCTSNISFNKNIRLIFKRVITLVNVIFNICILETAYKKCTNVRVHNASDCICVILRSGGIFLRSY